MNINDLKLIDKPFTGCPVCGGTLVSIRGRHPKGPKREVCPTCLADTLDDIHEISSKNYRIPCQVEK
jgi:ssDNA-binding Zn-finger/Zn-ribbon topoisomerase 1